LPLFHSNALNTFHQALLTGATMVLGRRFSASAYWSEVVAHGATVIYPLGAMVPILLAREQSALERGHRVKVALAPGVPADLHREFQRRTGIPIINGYGATETNFVIGSRVGEERPGYMGRAIPGFEVKVTAEGELAIRADDPLKVADGYFGMPVQTAVAWRDGWFHSGDRVVMEPDGYIRFVDRLKDAIRRRGENISSYEVEQALLAHPSVESAAVFPVPSELAEDEVMAAVVLRPGAALAESHLAEHCAARLPAFAVPRYIEFVAELPKTENGKIQKYRLRERGVTPATWDREKAHPRGQVSGRR
jgi:crotonobetaine/carnitine-CoA ligase